MPEKRALFRASWRIHCSCGPCSIHHRLNLFVSHMPKQINSEFMYKKFTSMHIHRQCKNYTLNKFPLPDQMLAEAHYGKCCISAASANATYIICLRHFRINFVRPRSSFGGSYSERVIVGSKCPSPDDVAIYHFTIPISEKLIKVIADHGLKLDTFRSSTEYHQ